MRFGISQVESQISNDTPDLGMPTGQYCTANGVSGSSWFTGKVWLLEIGLVHGWRAVGQCSMAFFLMFFCRAFCLNFAKGSKACIHVRRIIDSTLTLLGV